MRTLSDIKAEVVAMQRPFEDLQKAGQVLAERVRLLGAQAQSLGNAIGNANQSSANDYVRNLREHASSFNDDLLAFQHALREAMKSDVVSSAPESAP